MTIRIVEKDKVLIEKILKEPDVANEVVRRSLFEAGIRGKRLLLDGLTREGKTGVVAVDPSGQRFRRSAPGQMPSLETGNLRRSVNYEVRGAVEMEVGAGDGSSDFEYARYLEEGTEHIAPRPYIEPTVNRLHTDFIQDLEKFTKELFGV